MRLRQDPGGLLAHVFEVAVYDAAECFASLLGANVVFDEEDRCAGGVLATTKTRQFVVEHLHVLDAGRHQDFIDKTFLEFHALFPRQWMPAERERNAGPAMAHQLLLTLSEG